MYQASVWNKSISKATILPDPRNWGYAENESGKNLEFDWGTQLDIISAKKWDTFRSCSSAVIRLNVQPMEDVDAIIKLR
ncbi:MAG: hypothetical protein GY816_15045, partial [Cytophagales bacterium]|nr:hypothetical protein [Cytophagales bacterium]